jgi:hypothetical protein
MSTQDLIGNRRPSIRTNLNAASKNNPAEISTIPIPSAASFQAAMTSGNEGAAINTNKNGNKNQNNAWLIFVFLIALYLFFT